MTVSDLAVNMGLEAISIPHPEKVVTGAYAGDLLSWVMGRAEAALPILLQFFFVFHVICHKIHLFCFI